MVDSFIKKLKPGVFIFLLVLSHIMSQQGFGQTAVVRGTVQDESDNPLRKVEIVFHDVERGTQFEASTNKKGEFMKVGLPFSTYVVRFELEGYIPYETDLTVKPGREKRLSVTMRKVPLNIEEDNDFIEGIKLFQEGRYEEALELFLKVVERFPDHVETFYNLGVTYIRLDKIEPAIKALEKAVQIKPGTVEPYIALGECYLTRGQIDKAVSVLDQAVSVDFDNPETYFRLGLLYYKADKTENALRSFKKAIELDPEFSEAFYQAGLTTIKEGKIEEAVEYFETFLDLDPEAPEAEQVRAILKDLKRKEEIGLQSHAHPFVF